VIGPRPARLEIGRIARAHGLRGEVMVDLTTDQTDARCRPGQHWFTGSRELVVETIRPHQHRWLVVFDGVYSKEAADALAGVTLSAEPLDDPDAFWVHDLVGSLVVDAEGVERGRVTGVLANPAHPILELDAGGLVPTVFIESVSDGVIHVNTPEGLFDPA
jgi:16S rRNA processing protein RimM